MELLLLFQLARRYLCNFRNGKFRKLRYEDNKFCQILLNNITYMYIHTCIHIYAYIPPHIYSIILEYYIMIKLYLLFS